MENSSLVAVIGAIAIAAQAWRLIVLAKLKRQASPLKAQAKEQFLQTKSNPSEPRYRFQGATAKVIREEEFGPIRSILSTKTDYTLTIYATNEAGEFFVFKSSLSGTGGSSTCRQKSHALSLKINMYPSMAPMANPSIKRKNNGGQRSCALACTVPPLLAPYFKR